MKLARSHRVFLHLELLRSHLFPFLFIAIGPRRDTMISPITDGQMEIFTRTSSRAIQLHRDHVIAEQTPQQKFHHYMSLTYTHTGSRRI